MKSTWRTLCAQYLPLHHDGSVWRYSRAWLPSDPHQGWKIHISATILTACDVLQATGPYLRKCGVAFKAAATLSDLARINSGLHHGYSQVGKFLTVYPFDVVIFCEAVEELHDLIPPNLLAPAVPFDFRYLESNIYFRYGSFVPNHNSQPIIESPQGEFVLDRRDIPVPDGVPLPFAKSKSSPGRSLLQSPLASRYRVYSSLSQRGKGGVYEAIDTGTRPPRICIIKEGRRNGETAWDGRDGRVRVENEAKVLRNLGTKELNVPIIYDSFETEDNAYLVLERIDGTNLQKLNADRKRRRSLANTLHISKQICRIVADIHAAGYIWRDCKPANMFLTKENCVRPVDFEGACPIDQPDPFVWSTPNFTPPEIREGKRAKPRHFPVAEDLFALGTTLFFLVEGKLPPKNLECVANSRQCSADKGAWHVNDSSAINCEWRSNNRACSNVANVGNLRVLRVKDSECPLEKFSRRGLPEEVKQVISRLLSNDPSLRPRGEEVFAVLSLVESHLLQKRRKTRVVTNRIE